MTELIGGKKIEENMKRISQVATNAIEEALIKSALFVERDAKLNSPVDTGRLRASITHVTNDFGSKNPSVSIGTSVEYAPILEYGSSKQSAKPYLFPAFNSNKDKILNELAKALKKGAGL